MAPRNRFDVSFHVRGVKCAVWLNPPTFNHDKPVPAVIMAHGLEWRLDNIAQAFQKAGYACLVFHYRVFGDSDVFPRQIVKPKILLQDWREAIAYARTRTEIDPECIILFGTSLSGGHVTNPCAEDNRLAAVIVQCPFLDGFASIRMTDPLRLLRLTISATRDLTRKLFGKQAYLMDIGGAPGSNSLVRADATDFAAMIP